MAIIYEAVNSINGKRYIGFTKNTIENRKQQHQRDARRYSHLKFSRAILKYGINKFEFHILEESENSDWLLQKREPYWIAFFDTTKDETGYNICTGGRGRIGCDPWNKGISHSKETIQKLRRIATGRKQSPETIEKKNCKLKGKKRSTETKLKMSSTWEIITPSGDVIIIKNLQDFCRNNNLFSSCMINVANGSRKHHKGYKCKRLINGSQSRQRHSAS